MARRPRRAPAVAVATLLAGALSPAGSLEAQGAGEPSPIRPDRASAARPDRASATRPDRAHRPAGWEIQVLLDTPPGLTQRARALFIRRQGGALEAPILGPVLLDWLEGWHVVAPWPGLPGSLAGVTPTSELLGPTTVRRSADGRSAWTAAFWNEPPPLVTLGVPLGVPLAPPEVAVRARNVVWVLHHDSTGAAVWAAGIGPVDGAGVLAWHAVWRRDAGEGPTAWDAAGGIPHELVREARRTWADEPIWSSRATLSGVASSLRYNQVEGVSAALPVRVNLTATTHLEASVRGATSSYPLTGGAGIVTQRWPVTLGVEGYRSLLDANRWDPAVSSGRNSWLGLLFGQDYGYYYTTRGGRLFARYRHGSITWQAQLFGEEESPAPRRVDYTLFPDPEVQVPTLAAEPGRYHGAALLLEQQTALTMEEGIRVVRFWARGATGDARFLRTGVLVDLVRSWGWWAAGARFGGGATFGDPPPQWHYYVGGLSTVRGFDVAAVQGPMVALGRAEVGWGPPALRAVAFGDIGWAGERGRMPGVASAGLGLSLLEGMVRLDLAAPVRGGSGATLRFAANGLL